jgi:hypothetical protein
MISRLDRKVPIQINNNRQGLWSRLAFLSGCGLQMYGRGWYPAADMRPSSARGSPGSAGFPGDGLVCRKNEGLK